MITKSASIITLIILLLSGIVGLRAYAMITKNPIIFDENMKNINVRGVNYNIKAKWTFMIYLDEDNSLDGYGYNGDLQEAIQGYNPTARGLVNIICLDDRSGNGDTKLYFVDNNGTHDISSSASSWLSSEMDMGNPNTLIDFVEWSMRNYPAEHYFVDLWDHGGDYSGAMWDDTNNDHLTLADLRTAALTIHHDLGFPIDIWGYDACLMNAGADDYQIKQGVNIIVASEHTEGGDGWDYNALISNLTGNPSQTPEQYAYNFVVHVDDEHNRTGIVTMAAINSTKWDFWFMQTYNELAQAIRQKAGKEKNNITSAFNNTAKADSSYWSNGKDVGDFAKQLLNYVNDSKIKYWANRLLENVSKSVINSYDTDTNGRKIVMAETNSSSHVDSSFYIFKETEWDDMLEQVYNNGTDDNNSEPNCTILSPFNNSAYNKTSIINISGTANDSDGSISRVEVKIDRGDWLQADGTTKWNLKLNASYLYPGIHYIFARSYDGDLYSLYPNIKIYVSGPDLTLSTGDISFSNSNPIEGDTIAINATLHNIGNDSAENVNVSFYCDHVDSSHLIGTINYGNISEGKIITKGINWNTTGFLGEHKIIVYIDYNNSIKEINENNNIAIQIIKISNVPSPPQNLSSYSGNKYVNLTWKKPADDGGSSIIEYRVYRNGSLISTVPHGQLYYNDSNVKNGITYSYYVTAVNSAGESDKSNVVNAMPMSFPSSPINLSAVSGDGYVNLTWKKPADDGGSSIIEYRVYRGLSSGNEIVIAAPHSTFYNDTSVINGKTYFYYVTAMNSVGESDKSNEITATPKLKIRVPLPPQNLSSYSGNKYVNLTWKKPADDGGSSIIEYRVYRNGSLISTVPHGQLYYNDSNVKNGITYSYYVTAVNSAGESDKSNVVSATPRKKISEKQTFTTPNNMYYSLILSITAIAIILILILVYVLRKRETNHI